jgi:hypothetical protein
MIRVRRPQFLALLALAVLVGSTGSLGVFAADDLAPSAAAEVFEGQRLTLKAEVEGGEGPFHYLWYKDHLPLVGAVQSELTFESLQRSDSGTYWVTVFNDGGSTTSAPEVITVVTGRPSRLSNVSIVGSVRDRVIVGFTMGGNGVTGTTEVLARAAGPSLVPLGITNALADPMLSLSENGRPLANNDNWDGESTLANTAAAVGAFPFATTSKDSAVLLRLGSSSYLAEVMDGGDRTGITVIELYDTRADLADRAHPRLVNISARGTTGIEGAPLTAGFTIQGESSVTVLLRGIGPALEKLGVVGGVADPKLSLFQGRALISTNENWGDGDEVAVLEKAQVSVGAFALEPESLDAALLIRLRPGSYSAQLLSPASAGIGLIEVYEVP